MCPLVNRFYTEASKCELLSVYTINQPLSKCLLDHSVGFTLCVSLHLSTCTFCLLVVFQLATWALTAVRSQTCWIRAFRSAPSVLSSQLTTASSFCVASGIRASGFTPLTQVLYNRFCNDVCANVLL